MRRRRLVPTLVALLAPCLLVGPRGLVGPAWAEPPVAPRPLAVELAERLKTGLRVQAPADVAFCDAVARSVQEGRLPAKVVDATYLWAVNRGRKYPFPAFEQALRIKAARLGAAL